MAHVTKTERMLEAALHAHAGDPERVTVIDRTRKFKRSWIDLAEALCRVRDNESYLRWGFSSFHDYCTRELHLRRGTVDKLCASFGFLRANAPDLARPAPPRRAEGDDLVDDRPIPDWRAVNFVARAEERGAADERTLAEMKRAVFEEAAGAPALSRRYKEIAFPIGDAEKQKKLRGQIVTTARKLADLVCDVDSGVARPLAEQVELVVGELVTALEDRDEEGSERN